MNYQIAIPSYKRQDVLLKGTLATLIRYRAPLDRVHVFVADDEEKRQYEEALEKAGISVSLVVGVRGLCAQRRFIDSYFVEGTPLICIDDDLYDLSQKIENKYEPLGMAFDDLVSLGFRLAEENDVRLWGLYPVQNGMFMKNCAVVGLRFIYGVFCGTYAGYQCIQGEDEPFDGTAEDWERTLRSYRKYGNVLRIEWVSVKSRMYAAGGIQADVGGKEKRLAENKTRIQTVADRFPDLCSTYTKAGDILNIRLKNIVHKKILREEIESV